jgi:hypothetical protein
MLIVETGCMIYLKIMHKHDGTEKVLFPLISNPKEIRLISQHQKFEGCMQWGPVFLELEALREALHEARFPHASSKAR